MKEYRSGVNKAFVFETIKMDTLNHSTVPILVQENSMPLDSLVDHQCELSHLLASQFISASVLCKHSLANRFILPNATI